MANPPDKILYTRPCPTCGCKSTVSETIALAKKHGIMFGEGGSKILAKQIDGCLSLMDACVKCGTCYLPYLAIVWDAAETVLEKVNVVDMTARLKEYQPVLDAAQAAADAAAGRTSKEGGA